MQKKNITSCIVIGCKNRSFNPETTYYRVPISRVAMARQWYTNTLREELETAPHHMVCQEHFDPECFLAPGVPGSSLNDSAIPTLFEIDVFKKMLEHQSGFASLIASGQAMSTPRSSALWFNRPETCTTTQLSGDCGYNSAVSSSQLNSIAGNVLSVAKFESSYDHNDNGFLSQDTERPRRSIESLPDEQTRSAAQHLLLVNSRPFDERRRCAVPSCENHYIPLDPDRTSCFSPAYQLFPMPTNVGHRTRWQHACGINVEKGAEVFVCNIHFVPGDFDRHGSLKRLAMPSVFPESQIMDANNGSRDESGDAVPNGDAGNSLLAACLGNVSLAETTKRGVPASTSHGRRVDGTMVYKKRLENIDGCGAHHGRSHVVGGDKMEELKMTCEDEELSQYQLKAIGQSQNSSVAESSPRKSLPSSGKRSRRSTARSRPHGKTVVTFARPEPTPKASIPFLEPAFKQFGRHPPPPQQQVPLLKLGAVRTQEDGLETYVDRTYRFTLEKYYNRKMALTEHKPEQLENPSSIRCSLCHEMIADNIALAAHLCHHIESSPNARTIREMDHFGYALTQIACNRCFKEFENPFQLYIHYDTEHMYEIAQFQCRICEQKHGSLIELITHLNLCHCGLEMPYRCDECGFRTSFFDDAAFHIAKYHRGSKRFFCPFCLKTVLLTSLNNSTTPTTQAGSGIYSGASAYTHLIQHFNRKENDRISMTKCKGCRKCTLHLRMIKDHIRRDHPNIVAGAKASYFSDGEQDERYLLACGTITAVEDDGGQNGGGQHTEAANFRSSARPASTARRRPSDEDYCVKPTQRKRQRKNNAAVSSKTDKHEDHQSATVMLNHELLSPLMIAAQKGDCIYSSAVKPGRRQRGRPPGRKHVHPPTSCTTVAGGELSATVLATSCSETVMMMMNSTSTSGDRRGVIEASHIDVLTMMEAVRTGNGDAIENGGCKADHPSGNRVPKVESSSAQCSRAADNDVAEASNVCYVLTCIECRKILGQGDGCHFSTSRQCDLCSFESACATAFERHERGHHDQLILTLGSSKPIQTGLMRCGNCAFSSNDGDLMALHMATAMVKGCPLYSTLASCTVYPKGVATQDVKCGDRCTVLNL